MTQQDVTLRPRSAKSKRASNRYPLQSIEKHLRAGLRPSCPIHTQVSLNISTLQRSADGRIGIPYHCAHEGCTIAGIVTLSRLECFKRSFKKAWVRFAMASVTTIASLGTAGEVVSELKYGRHLFEVIAKADELFASGLVGYENEAKDLGNLREKFLRAAKKEVWFVGANFYVTAVEQVENILDALARGVNVTFAFVPPNASKDAFERGARKFGKASSDSSQQLRGESIQTVLGLRLLLSKLEARAPTPGKLRVLVLEDVPSSCVYLYDPELPEGHAVLVTHLDGVNSPNTPGFVFAAGPESGLNRCWRWVQDLFTDRALEMDLADASIVDGDPSVEKT